MMSKLKWIVVLACFLLLACLAGTASAGTTGDLTWTLSDGTLTISGNGAMPDYEYDPGDSEDPECVECPWWRSRGLIRKIVIDEGVTEIGEYAFRSCYNAAEVSLPTTVTRIGQSAFRKTTALTGITFPEGLKTIGEYAFSGSGLTGTVTLPNSLETLSSYSLNSSGITEVVFGSGLESMEQYSVPTNAALTGTGGNSGTYEGMTWCQAGHVLFIRGSGEMPTFSMTHEMYHGQIQSTDYSMPWWDYSIRPLIHKVLICNGMTSISANAFRSMSNLTSIVIPSGVTKIGANAFYYCSTMTGIQLPSSVNSIGASAFEGCQLLTRVQIPSGVTEIPGNTFYNCSSLKHISIPTTVTSIGANAFYGCTKMEEVLYGCTSINTTSSYTGYAGNWSYITFGNKHANPMAASGKAKLYVTYGDEMGEVHMNNSSPSVSPYAYYNCRNNFKVVANGGYTGVIGQYAFYNCPNLTSIELPSSVYRVETYAFYNCSAVTDTYMLFDGLTYIGDHAFRNCTGITAINQNYYSNSAVTYLGESAFDGCTGLTTVTMNLSEGTVKNYAFGGCSNLDSITLLKKAPASIEAYAFSSTTTQVKYYDGASWEGKIKNYGGVLTWKAAGSTCGPDASWKMTDEGRLIISGSGEVTSEGWSGENGITGLEIADRITGTTNVSFSKVSRAKQGTLDGGDNWVLTPDGVLHIFGTAAMPDMAAGHETWQATVNDVRIHEGVTKIGAYAFDTPLSAGMTRVKYPGTLTEIRRSAFEGCNGLTDLYFPDPVPTTFTDAFKGVTANAWYLYTSEPGTISSGNLTWRSYCAWVNGAAVPHRLAQVEELLPTCTEDGHAEHFYCEGCESLFEDEDALYILEEEDVLLEKTGHAWNAEPVFLWADNGKACEVTFGCSKCELTQTTDAEITSEAATAPTDMEGGVTEYTATAMAPDGKVYTDKKQVADIPARFTWNGTAIKAYNLQEEEVRIPEGTTALGLTAFKNCTSVKQVYIPDSVVSIGENAFSGCSEELTIYSSQDAYAHTYAVNRNIRWALYTPPLLTVSQNGQRTSFVHGQDILVEYDLGDLSYSRATLEMQAWYQGNYYTFEPVELTERKGTYTFTNTDKGDSILFEVRLKDAEGRNLPDPEGNEKRIEYADDWQNKPAQIPVLNVTRNQSSVTAGTPISASYSITGYTGELRRCEVYWAVYDENEEWVINSRYNETETTGEMKLIPTVKGLHVLKATVQDAAGWTFRPENREQGILVTTDGTDTPLSIELSWTDADGNALDWTTDKAEKDQRINMTWAMSGGYAPYEGYLDVTPLAGANDINFTRCYGSTGTTDFSPGEQDLVLKIDYYDDHGNSGTETVTIPVYDESQDMPEAELAGRFGLNGMEENLSLTAEYFTAPGIGLEPVSGKMYSTDRLFSWQISNMEEIRPYLNEDEAPEFSVTLEKGNAVYTTETYDDERGTGIEVKMTALPASGDVEFKATCTIREKTYEQMVKFTFTEITGSLPTKLTGDVSSPKILKAGDEIPYYPQVAFENGWTIGENGYGTEYGGGDDFFGKVNWKKEVPDEPGVPQVAETGMAECRLVAYSANLYMSVPATYVFTGADGTIPESQYTPFGTVTKLPAAITKIESEAFTGTKITEADIPAGTVIADDAFAGSGLIAVYTHNDPEIIEWAVGHGIVAITEEE